MRLLRYGTWWRWSVTAAVVLGLASLPAAVAAFPVRPPRTDPAQLAARVRASAVQPYQGYAVSTGSAGLPALPQLTDVTDLLSGETQLRVWYASADQWRVDELGLGTERDTYQMPAESHRTQMVWDYGRNQLTAIDGDPTVRLPVAADLVPPDLGRRLLAAADRTSPATPGAPGDTLSALPARRIAGIAAPGMRITPNNPVTTVGYIDIWADPATGLPLEVAVTGRGATSPFLDTRFLDLQQRAPDPAVVAPPSRIPAGAGFTVTDAEAADDVLNQLIAGPLPASLAGQPRADFGATAITVDGQFTYYLPDGRSSIGAYGSGLAQFLVLPLPRRTGFDVMRRATRGGGVQFNLPAGEAVLISTPLLSLVAMDGHASRQTYLLVGLVDPKLLKQAAADLSTYRRF
jgi:hypothetical protein